MVKIDFGQNCQLVQNLLEVSQADAGNRKAEIASALLYGLGYPFVPQHLPDISFTRKLVPLIAASAQADLLHESAVQCINCAHSGRCELETIFKVG